MDRTRRELLAGAGASIAVGLAGCTGRLTVDGATFSAAEPTLDAGIQRDTGYSHYRTTYPTERREYGQFGLSRTVEVTNVVSEYDRAIEPETLGIRLQAAVFATLSTPQIRVLGRSFNPVERMSAAELAELIQQRYDEIDDVRDETSLRIDVAGQPTTVSRFIATARLVVDEGTYPGVDVYLYVSRAVNAGDDLVVALAVHPWLFGRRTETIRTMMAGIEHG